MTQIIVFDPGGKILQPWKVRKVDEKCEKQKLKRQPRTVKKELKDKQTVQDANMKHSKTYPNVGSKEQENCLLLDLEPEQYGMQITFHIRLSEARTPLIKTVQEKSSETRLKLRAMSREQRVLEVRECFPPELIMTLLIP